MTQCGKCGADKLEPGQEQRVPDYKEQHTRKFSHQQEQRDKFSNSRKDSGRITYPKKDLKKLPGWDVYHQASSAVSSVQTNAFTPIWPAVPAQERAAPVKEAEAAPSTSQTSSKDFVPNTIPSSVSSGMRAVMESVIESTTPLSTVSYRDQLKKKAGEARKLVDVLGTEIMTANGDTNNWFEFQKSKHGAAARVDEVRESPTIEGYRNKCEFAIGLNPENRRLTVGFKLDPR